ncbi:transketolase family protein [Anaeromicrobium sediminis]|uniref:Transketolase n=1 Tax=Anaeromicrobium sediminis TaxID=1478221 RepID=A0A267MN51_9FIRM|nr:transketolase family protein [Anaeromicrobium sediminis]PAB61031.1 transketolase [Anaeromicrobium sediminis]
MRAPRDVYGEVLFELGEKYENIIVLNSDLAKATKTTLFEKKFPQRHFNLGICEQNMMSIGGGLSSEGFIPIASTFAIFATGRAYDQIRQSIAYPKNNVKIIATHPGLAVGLDGATHQALEDINIMRGLPNMTVLAPSDEVETKKLIEKAIEYDGPTYIRVGRAEIPQLFNSNTKFQIGKGNVLREGSDITILSHGIMLYHSLEVAKRLLQKNISVEVISMASIKPIDKELILKSSKKTNCVVTIEDHSIYGGLGSAVAEVLIQKNPVPQEIIGVSDIFGESGTPNELFEKYGLDINSLEKRILDFYHSNKY